MVAYMKFGDKIYEHGMVVRHLDGNHFNNCFDNIEIGTQTDNIMDIPKEIRSNHSKNTDRTHYTIEQIKEFKSYVDNGHTYKQTIIHFGISSIGKLRNNLQKLI